MARYVFNSRRSPYRLEIQQNYYDRGMGPFIERELSSWSATLEGTRITDEMQVTVALEGELDIDFVDLFGEYAVQYLLENRIALLTTPA